MLRRNSNGSVGESTGPSSSPSEEDVIDAHSRADSFMERDSNKKTTKSGSTQAKTMRLIGWNVEVLHSLLQKVVVHRQPGCDVHGWV